MFTDRIRRPVARYQVRAVWSDGSLTKVTKRAKRDAAFLAADLRCAAGCQEAAVFNLVTGELSY